MTDHQNIISQGVWSKKEHGSQGGQGTSVFRCTEQDRCQEAGEEAVRVRRDHITKGSEHKAKKSHLIFKAIRNHDLK